MRRAMPGRIGPVILGLLLLEDRLCCGMLIACFLVALGVGVLGSRVVGMPIHGDMEEYVRMRLFW